jgi:hypothetical protein
MEGAFLNNGATVDKVSNHSIQSKPKMILKESSRQSIRNSNALLPHLSLSAVDQAQPFLSTSL